MSTMFTAATLAIRKVALPSLLINVLSLAVPLTVLQIYDRIIPNQSYGTATLLLFGATVAVLLDSFLRYVRSWLLAASSSQIEQQRYEQIITTLSSAPSRQITKLRVGGVQSGLDAVAKVKDIYSGSLMSGLIDFPFALLFLFLIYYVGGELVFVPIAVWVVTALVVWFSSAKATERTEQSAKLESNRIGFLLGMTRHLLGIKRQAGEYKTYTAFKKLNQQHRLNLADEEAKQSFAQECIYLASLGTSVAIVIIGSLYVLDGDLTTGGLAACSILAGRAVAPLSAIVSLRLRYGSMQSSLHAVNQLLELTPEKQPDINQLTPLTSFELIDVEFERFGNTYQVNGSLATQSLNLITAVPNESACHFLTILSGLAPTTSGDIKVNGITVDHNQLRALGSYTASKATILQGSILDNLCGFQPSIAQNALTFAKKLGLYQVLTQLPDGLETKIGDMQAIPLSQSSVRMITLCHALALDNDLLVIDKPELDLDIDSWPKLAEVLINQTCNGKTVVIVSHNPVFVDLCTHQLTIEKAEEHKEHAHD
ncbi:ABC transporter [Vibrio sp. ZSDZ34]|uniref:ABC transporter n=1 Tax=Vibrio gelatinilyticus TaxID=2893468 RepID=A0A9X1WDQ3_9VIBR|nr:ABC transporter transmembrane domain-containing protein [Vibrio gelatinilyticus]MCJ2376530.1 ABC transporter [Vibrio gelatinilyticus]